LSVEFQQQNSWDQSLQSFTQFGSTRVQQKISVSYAHTAQLSCQLETGHYHPLKRCRVGHGMRHRNRRRRLCTCHMNPTMMIIRWRPMPASYIYQIFIQMGNGMGSLHEASFFVSGVKSAASRLSPALRPTCKGRRRRGQR
jgi:hypothetical protein